MLALFNTTPSSMARGEELRLLTELGRLAGRRQATFAQKSEVAYDQMPAEDQLLRT